MQLVLFNPEIGPYQVLPRRARMDLGAMVIKGYSAFPKLRQQWNLIIRLFSVISRTLIMRGFYPSVEMQSMYSTAPADWAHSLLNDPKVYIYIYIYIYISLRKNNETNHKGL